MSDKITLSSKIQQKILLFSVAYLMLPYIIFYIGWLKVQYSTILCITLIAVFIFAKNEVKKLMFTELEIVPSSLCFIAILVLCMLIITGFGGLCGIQASDWTRDNVILSDLYNKNWPVVYMRESSEPYALNYYIAYYLPAALAGKMMHSYRVVEITLLGTTYIGFLLGIFWMVKSTGAGFVKSVAIFFTYSGLDCVGFVITTGRFFGAREHLDHWAIQADGQDFIANYMSIGTAIRWALNHYIATWISLFIILNLIRKKEYKLCLLVVILTLLWAPVAAIGFIPFMIVIFFYEKCDIRKFFSIPNVLALFSVVVPCGLYFMSAAASKAGREQIIRNPQWFLENWVTVALFIILEFGIWCWLISKSKCLQSNLDKLLVLTSFASMTFFLIIDYGLCHDFSMQASIVPHYVIFSFLPRAFSLSRGIVKEVFKVALVLSFISTSTEYTTALCGLVYNPVTCERALLEVNTLEGWWLEYQYIGNMSSPFYDKLCKKNFSIDENTDGKVCAYSITDSIYTSGIAQRDGYVDILIRSQDIEPNKRIYSLISEQGTEVLVTDSHQVQTVFYKISISAENPINLEEFQYPNQFSISYLAKNEILPLNLTDGNWTNGISNNSQIILVEYEQELYDKLTSAKRLHLNNGAVGDIINVQNVNDTYIHIYFNSMENREVFAYPSIILIED